MEVVVGSKSSKSKVRETNSNQVAGSPAAGAKNPHKFWSQIAQQAVVLSPR